MTERITVSIPEAAKALGISHTYAYELAKAGRIPTVRLGRRLLVPIRALEEQMNDEARMTAGDAGAGLSVTAQRETQVRCQALKGVAGRCPPQP